MIISDCSREAGGHNINTFGVPICEYLESENTIFLISFILQVTLKIECRKQTPNRYHLIVGYLSKLEF